MKANIVPIGNSKGIRIPQALLRLCHIKNEVDIDVKGEMIVIHPVKRKPRTGWGEAFKAMHEHQEDRLLVDDRVDLDMGNWEW